MTQSAARHMKNRGLNSEAYNELWEGTQSGGSSEQGNKTPGPNPRLIVEFTKEFDSLLFLVCEVISVYDTAFGKLLLPQSPAKRDRTREHGVLCSAFGKSPVGTSCQAII